MVDYKKFLKKTEEHLPIDPIEIFNRLGGMEKINDLYGSQKDVLTEWYSRRESKDLVVKLHTGGGKTLVGFLIALSIMNETKKGVIYLVPNRQLEAQAYEKAVSYRIPVTDYNENSQDPISDDFLRGRKILVATYKALFNAKSRFGILHGHSEIVQVGGIIVDDAHSSFSVIRESFSIRIEREKNYNEFKALVELFANDLRKSGVFETFKDIVTGDENGILEIPYWIWGQRISEVQKILENAKEKFQFEWPFIRDKLRECLAIIGSNAITITPLFPLVKMIPTFSECNRRVYMSATLDDDSPLIENFDADPDPLANPITAKTLAGIGERQIIIPMITGLPDKEDAVRSVIKTYSKRGFGIVILIPAQSLKSKWEQLGAEFADSPNKVDEFVKLLIDRSSDGPYIFANRYDGIDLPGDSCRILIIDGIPFQSGEYEKYQSKAMTGSTFLSSLIAVRIEQGIGRASRGRGDYSVVLLTGQRLPSWVSKNYYKMTAGTRAQIEIAYRTTKEIDNIKSLYDTIDQCLKRDRNWVDYHAQELATLTELPKPDKVKLAAIGIMRKAFNLADDGNYEDAIAKLNSIFEMSIDDKYKGIANEMQARFYFYWGKIEDCETKQKAAFSLNRNLLKPQTPPPYTIMHPKIGQAKAILDSLREYKFKKAFLDDFESVILNLNSQATSNQFEDSLNELAKFIGLQSERPENTFKEGPDVLWLLPDNNAYVIEAKSLKKPENKFAKKDLGQLLSSLEWFREKYKGWTGVPVSIHINENADSSIAVNKVKVLTLSALDNLVSEIRGFLYEICRDDLSESELVTTIESSLTGHGLIHSEITRVYLKKFRQER